MLAIKLVDCSESCRNCAIRFFLTKGCWYCLKLSKISSICWKQHQRYACVCHKNETHQTYLLFPAQLRNISRLSCCLWRNESMKVSKGGTGMPAQKTHTQYLAAQIPQIHLKDIWRAIKTCSGTDGKHHSDLMGEDAFYSGIKHFCFTAP